MSPEVTYVSSDDDSNPTPNSPDIVCTSQWRRRTIIAPQVKKRESTVPRVPQKKPRIMIDLVDDEPTGSSSATSAPALRESSLSKTIREAKERRQADQWRKTEPSPDSQPHQVEPIVISDSDDEEHYAAYDLANDKNWQPTGASSGTGMSGRDLQKEIADIAQEIASLMPVKRRERAKDAVNMLHAAPVTGSIKPPNIRPRRGKPEYVWTTLQREMSSRTRCSRNIVPVSSKWPHTPAARFRMAAEEIRARFSPGSVNSIAQTSGLVAVASCVLGGGADDEEESGANMPYNNPGSLKVISKDNTFTLHGHEDWVDARDGEGDRKVKHYTVNEVQFDPANSTRLVSCGRDKRVMIWDCGIEDSKPGKLKSVEYTHVPDGIQFKPTGTTFVTWTSKGKVGVHHDLDDPQMIDCTPKPEPIQSVMWGKGRLQHLVYLTTEVENGTRFTGKHMALDVENRRTTAFSRKTAGGQCLDINQTGTQLAHVTRARGGDFKLSMLDIRADPKTSPEIVLPRFVFKLDVNRVEPQPSVLQVLFSPDSLYVAVARNDNVTYVYDARFLDKGYLYNLPHRPPVEASGDDNFYGVPKVEWLEGRTQGLSLVSCGADGCVRLWDMKRAHGSDADTVIAESVSYAGWFSLGNTFNGEKTLILGDGSGNLVIKE